MNWQHVDLRKALVALCGLTGFAIQADAQDSKGALPAAAAGDQVIIKREPSHILPPHKYRIPLFVTPIRTLTLTAPFDGIVRQTDGKPNSKVQAQTEIVRLDTTVAKLNVQRAEAALKVATAEQKQAAEKDETEKALAQARVDVVKAELELAKYMLEQATVRTPFSGELQRVLVTDGQFVRAGDPLAVVVDTSKVRIEVPAERSAAVQGKSIPLKIEAAEVEAKVDSVLPLDSRFDVLRDLFDSVVSAVVVIDNSDGRYKPGQTVYVPLIPRQPVAEVPTAAIGNLSDGQRKVQVVRHFVVRDVPVILMGSIGTNRLFVSGAFAEGDEVIYESSHQLADAYQLKPAAPGATTTAGATTTPAAGAATTPAAATPAKPTVGF